MGHHASILFTDAAAAAEAWLRKQPEGWNRSYELSRHTVESAKRRGYNPLLDAEVAMCGACLEREGVHAVWDSSGAEGRVCNVCRTAYDVDGQPL